MNGVTVHDNMRLRVCVCVFVCGGAHTHMNIGVSLSHVYAYTPAKQVSDPLGATTASPKTSDRGLSAPATAAGADNLNPAEIRKAISFAHHLAQEQDKVVDSVKIAEAFARYYTVQFFLPCLDSQFSCTYLKLLVLTSVFVCLHFLGV